MKGIVERLNIRVLVHFTNAQNLPAILEHGLLPRTELAKYGIPATINDPLRPESFKEAISLSISFPDYKRFYHYRGLNAGTPWAVLTLRPSILWKKNCDCYRHNAADPRLAAVPVLYLGTSMALRDMFAELQGLPSRRDQRLRLSDPTDAQAEVLVYDPIEPEQILTVEVNCRQTLSYLKQTHPLLSAFYRAEGTGMFAARPYMR